MKATDASGESFTQEACDYQRIEKAIGFLRDHFLEQPDLSAMARHVHLSEFHFQRLFSRWAGISPKRFLQFLTVESAKAQLEASKALLEVTLDAGLSSPGRLHDLFVVMEAVTPGEFKTRGAGLTIQYGIHPSPFGQCLIAVTGRGLCGLSFLDGEDPSDALADLRERWSGATLRQQPDATEPFIARIFNRAPPENGVPLKLLVTGTNFQIQVWRALLRVPPGALTTYQTLAAMTQKRTAARAVGNAVARNPVAYLIPCHRVIRSTGLLGNYRWGAARKQAMLAWEAARAREVA